MNNQMSNIEKIALSGKRVFTIADLAVIWQIADRRKLVELAKYYVNANKLKRIHKGVYGYGPHYTKLDIAQKLVPMSYISLYTTSQMHGLTFQYYGSVFCMALSSKKYTVDNQTYIYHAVKEPVFYNTSGLIDNGRYFMAGIERTICDCLYVFPNFAFDNLRSVDTEKIRSLSRIYGNKRLERDIDNLIAGMG